MDARLVRKKLNFCSAGSGAPPEPALPAAPTAPPAFESPAALPAAPPFALPAPAAGPAPPAPALADPALALLLPAVAAALPALLPPMGVGSVGAEVQAPCSAASDTTRKEPRKESIASR